MKLREMSGASEKERERDWDITAAKDNVKRFASSDELGVGGGWGVVVMPPWVTFFSLLSFRQPHTHTHTFTCQFNFLIKHAFNFKSVRRGHAAHSPSTPLGRSAPLPLPSTYNCVGIYTARCLASRLRQQSGDA